MLRSTMPAGSVSRASVTIARCSSAGPVRVVTAHSTPPTAVGSDADGTSFVGANRNRRNSCFDLPPPLSTLLALAPATSDSSASMRFLARWVSISCGTRGAAQPIVKAARGILHTAWSL